MNQFKWLFKKNFFLGTPINKKHDRNPWFMPLLISLCKKWQKTHVRKNIPATNEVRQHGPRGPRFYFFGGGWRCWIFVAHNVFS
jgi:hypothetical protein